jgi:hypothetical protein
LSSAILALEEKEATMPQVGPYTIEQRVYGDTVWVAIRARGAEWSWLTPEEAARIGRAWVAAYGTTPHAVPEPVPVAAE